MGPARPPVERAGLNERGWPLYRALDVAKCKKHKFQGIRAGTARGSRMTITAAQAQPGDVLLDDTGTVWQRGDELFEWSTFSGPVGYYGPWSDAYGPQGELTVLVRDGKPAGV